jgi:hypothetical protein
MSLSSASTIDLNHPSLNTPITLADPDRPYLQHGLEYDEQGQVRIKPAVEAKMRPSEIARVKALIAAGRLPEANSLVACGRIHKSISQCPDRHEVEAAQTICDRPLLHEKCARAKRREAKLTHEHPELVAFLLHTSYSVLTLTIPSDRHSVAAHRQLRECFKRFRSRVVGEDSHKEYGWLSSVSFAGAPGTVESRVICYHEDGLAAWPTLNKLWQQIAPPGSTFRVRTFDGHDGDLQSDGLLYAMGGFEPYWMSIRPGEELALSAEFLGYDLTGLYGMFRSFTASMPDPPPLTPTLCATCGKEHISALHLPLMPIEELLEMFDHINLPGYGKSRWYSPAVRAMVSSRGSPSPPS